MYRYIWCVTAAVLNICIRFCCGALLCLGIYFLFLFIYFVFICLDLFHQPHSCHHLQTWQHLLSSVYVTDTYMRWLSSACWYNCHVTAWCVRATYHRVPLDVIAVDYITSTVDVTEWQVRDKAGFVAVIPGQPRWISTWYHSQFYFSVIWHVCSPS